MPRPGTESLFRVPAALTSVGGELARVFRLLPCPLPPIHILGSRIWCLIPKCLGSWKSELGGGGRGW